MMPDSLCEKVLYGVVVYSVASILHTRLGPLCCSLLLCHLAAPISTSLSLLLVCELPRLDGLRAAQTVRQPCIH
jgi:hypothetical protein